MKTSGKKYITLALYGAVAITISFGGYFGIDLSNGYFIAMTVSGNVIIPSLFAFCVNFINGGVKLYGSLALTLIFAISSYLLKLSSGRLKQVLELVFALLFGVLRQLFFGITLYGAITSALSCLIAFYFSKRLFDDSFELAIDSDFIALSVVVFCFALGLSEIKVFGACLLSLFIPIITGLSTRYLGRERGVFLSLIFAIAAYIATKESDYLLAMAIFAITAYLFIGRTEKLLPVSLIAENIILRCLCKIETSESVIAILFFSIGALSLYVFPEKAAVIKPFTATVDRLIKEALDRSSKRIKELSDIYKDLARSIRYDLKSENIPNRIVNECVKSCGYCKHRDKCKILKKHTEYFEPLAVLAISKGSINMLDLGDSIYSNCRSTERLINTVNSTAMRANADSLKQKERAEFNATLNKIFSGLSDALSFESSKLNKSIDFDRALELDIYEELKLNGITAKEVYCVKTQNGTPSVKVVLDDGINKKLLTKVISSACGVKMKAGKATKEGVITYFPRPECEVVVGVSRMPKGGEKASSGDNYIVEKLSDNTYILAISDGMGTGKEASEASERTVNVIEDLFKAGFSCDVICPIVNSVVETNGNEAFSATDVVTVDPINMSALIMKLGTPPTFLVKEKVIELSGSSLPFGILDDVTPEIKTVSISIGDVLVIMSDGVYDALKERSAYYIEKAKALSPQEISDELIKTAIECNGGEVNDDMTVLAVKII